MHKKWVVAAKKADFNQIARQFGISPYLARIIRNRDVIGDDAVNMYLNGSLSDLHAPNLMKDIPEAADILMDAIDAGAKIRIVGDYDVDGVCASYILQKGIKSLGGDADVRLPDRILDGYGINEEIITQAYNDGVELIVTCDNGIAAAKEIEKALQLGMSVIVTDHHEVPYEGEGEDKFYILPEADAVVDPKQPDCNYPFSGICGATVAYKLISYILNNPEYAMYTDNISGADSIDELKKELLSFAAFATICDVMELKDENRIIVKYGLKLLAQTKNVGLNALINVTGVDRSALNVFHVGFILGPCINATGRLDSATKALELFNEENPQQAVLIAEELRSINESRKNMTVSFTEAAIEMVENQYSDDKVIVVYLPSCHESIAGIVAGKVRERFYKPAIVLTNDAEGNIKGSGRSIEAYNMYEELTLVNNLFTKYGGHKLAAGLSMKAGSADELRSRLNASCRLTEEDLVEKCVIDIPMPIDRISKDFVSELDKLGPFGTGNPKPLFAQKDVSVINASLIGKNQNVLKLRLEAPGQDGINHSVDAVLFENAKDAYEEIRNHNKISILYQAGLNEYMGQSSVQLTIKDYCF